VYTINVDDIDTPKDRLFITAPDGLPAGVTLSYNNAGLVTIASDYVLQVQFSIRLIVSDAIAQAEHIFSTASEF
jgi:hypothetical protein